MPDVTGEQQFLLAASRPIRIEYGTRLWDNNDMQIGKEVE